MRLNAPLAVGAVGGHGPIRYTVEAYEPGRFVRFRFTGPRGFHGTHAFAVEPAEDAGTRLRHELVMRTGGAARLTWPVVFRPLHDALIEDAFDRAAVAIGQAPMAPAWSPWVRILRVGLGRVARRRRQARPPVG
jgi:carbon monoxide dehydrogenase subunit G